VNIYKRRGVGITEGDKLRSLKRSERGISPVIATILLIAVTAVAAGVIAAFVGGLFVAAPRLVVAVAEGAVYDNVPGVAENYVDRDAVVAAVLASASADMRDASDPGRGFSVRLLNPRTGFTITLTPSINNETNTYITQENRFENLEEDQDLIATLTYYVDPDRDIPPGSSITVTLDVENDDPDVEWWREEDTIEIYISARDSISLTGYDGAYLSARALD
jgi:flagellin-like protein